MKRLAVLITFVLGAFILQAQEKENYKFFMSANMGKSSFIGKSGISIIDHDQDKFEAIKFNGIIGWDNNKQSFGLEFFLSGTNAKYNDMLSESIGINGVGFFVGGKYMLNNDFYTELSAGAGLLCGRENIAYSTPTQKFDFDPINRYGAYAKVGLSLGVEVNSQMSFGLKGEVFAGALDGKDLPTEIMQYKVKNNNVIGAYSSSIFVKIRL